jgi:hypothetical protein
MDRRSFVRSVAAALPLTVLPACEPQRAGVAGAQGSGLESDLLGAVGDTVLPGELGADGRRRVLDGFSRWLAEYKAAGELNHGYGTGELRYAPADPGAGWAAQLHELDLEANERFGHGFTSISADQRRGMLSEQIAMEGAGRLPQHPEYAHHVAVGLLTYFYSTPEATDLCYGAHIGVDTCRSLEDAPKQPAPLSAAPSQADAAPAGRGRGRAARRRVDVALTDDEPAFQRGS